MEGTDSMLLHPSEYNIHLSMRTRTIKAIIFMTGVCASLISPFNGITDSLECGAGQSSTLALRYACRSTDVQG